MSRARDLRQLAALAGMIRDLRLADVSAAGRARQQSLDRLAGLNAPQADDLDPLAEARAALRYQVWADQRRAEILPVLERQTADLNRARDEARHALGRAEVLARLSLKR